MNIVNPTAGSSREVRALALLLRKDGSAVSL